MEPTAETLRLYHQPSDAAALEWAWVDGQLAHAGAYWTTSRSPGHPHPRPLWGIWRDHRLHLSIGSPVLVRQLEADPAVTVHLGHDTDVVIVEGAVAGATDAGDLVAAYDAKYDWSYTVAEYGPLTTVEPVAVLAWRSAGWAGRGGFQQSGRWRY
ncbi:MAG: hypothetical protein OES57_13780 [Acidimicrobiia bacterium]|nr:hypothetical protein [Acidimicrobiia bacterium]